MRFRIASLFATLLLPVVANAAPSPVLTVAGAPVPLALGTADLAAMPRGKAVLVVHGTTAACEGVWLADVLAKAGVPAGESVKGAALAQVVVAQAADGYRVVFSLGEIDRALGNGVILVADKCDGKALPPEDGPVRLVVAGEKRGARSVRGLTTLTLVAVGAAKESAIR